MAAENTGGSDIVRTFIWGSCVSRDTFGFLPDSFEIARYVARQSLISAGTDVSSVRSELKPLASSFQQRMVVGDLAGDLFRALASADDVDLVLIDLVDERGGVVGFQDGFATKLSEFWGAGGREASRGAQQIVFGSDEHFALWKQGAIRFVGELRRRELLPRTVVLRASWASTYVDGEALEIPSWMMRPEVADDAYARYFDVLGKLGLRILELPKELAHTSKEHRWGASPFHYQDEAYEYFARAICEVAAAPRTAPAEELSLARRDAAAWGAFTTVDSPADIAAADLSGGLLTLRHHGIPIDLQIEDSGAATTLVSFHAALGKSGLKPPVFTGRSISSDLQMNRIFVSDPGLLADADLGLAWYLGTNRLDLTRVLSEAIQALQARMGAKHLVFFGMSGGGFAAMNFAHEFPGSLAVPVNPQTRILDYAEVHWDAMARACFGSVSAEQSRAILESHPRADMRKVYRAGFPNSVIYVQNTADPHVTSHLIPWFEAIEWREGAAIAFGRWGTGHVPPPGNELREMLSALPDADGDWNAVAAAWGANLRPTRDMVKSTTGR